MSKTSLPLRLAVPFCLNVTLCCGQVFRWEKRGDWWFGVVDGNVVKVRQVGEVLEFSSSSSVDESFITRYFSLDHDLPRIGMEIGKDEHVRATLREFRGVRLIRQDPWECLISFICATYKNVPAIKQMLQKLSARFGESLMFEGWEFFTFPSAEPLTEASIRELETCGLGYRARYVQETARKVQSGGFDFTRVKQLPYDEAKRALLEFPGVGRKVADCVLLFSLEKLEAFPVDVWMKRVLLRHYAACFDAAFVKKLSEQGGLGNGAYERLNGFGRAYFGRFAGYAQEYLYHYERCLAERTAENRKVANRKIEKGLSGIEQQPKHTRG